MNLSHPEDPYLSTQLRMGAWLNTGLWMPIDDINYGYSRDLLNHLLGRDVVNGLQYNLASLSATDLEVLNRLLGPHGYAYFRALLEQRGPFTQRAAEVPKHAGP